uniref:Uncharacterized protein n=1 Tax=Anguilla anguilla TaxID=7936 RepID=A0A0E9QHV4_ANGAN
MSLFVICVSQHDSECQSGLNDQSHGEISKGRRVWFPMSFSFIMKEGQDQDRTLVMSLCT